MDVTFSFLSKEKVTKKKSRVLVIFLLRVCAEAWSVLSGRFPGPQGKGNGGFVAAAFPSIIKKHVIATSFYQRRGNLIVSLYAMRLLRPDYKSVTV